MGEDGTVMAAIDPKEKPRERRSFSREFKERVVRLVLEDGKTRAQVARELDLPPSVVTRWVARAQASASPEGQLSADERTELERLRKENRLLRTKCVLLRMWASCLAKEIS